MESCVKWHIDCQILHFIEKGRVATEKSDDSAFWMHRGFNRMVGDPHHCPRISHRNWSDCWRRLQILPEQKSTYKKCHIFIAENKWYFVNNLLIIMMKSNCYWWRHNIIDNVRIIFFVDLFKLNMPLPPSVNLWHRGVDVILNHIIAGVGVSNP